MIALLKSATLAVLIGCAAVVSAPASAKADGLYFSLGQDGPRFGAYLGDRSAGYDRRYARNQDRRCTPRRALDKADRLGVNRAFVASAGPNRIRVHGRKHGERVRLVFARGAGCPILRW